MSQDLRLLDAWVTKEHWPHVACPVCGEGSLTVGELHGLETTVSRRARRHVDRDPVLREGYFHGALHCALSRCGEVIVILGDYSVDVDADDCGEMVYQEFFKIRAAHPPLTIMLLPDKTPESVQHAVSQASAVIWSDPSSAGNRLRTAIEEVLTQQRVRRHTTSKAGKRVRLTTHQRIELLQSTQPEAADTLMAVKWIGNEGAHDQTLTVSDVLDGADLLVHAFTLLYDTSKKDLARRVREINRRKGLSRRRGAR